MWDRNAVASETLFDYASRRNHMRRSIAAIGFVLLFVLLTFAQVQTPTTTSLTVSASTLNVPSLVTMTASVTPSAAGLVKFTDGNTLLGTVVLDGGSATYKTTGLAGGSHTLTATFVGTTSAAGSNSAPSLLTLNAAATSTSLAITGGNPVTLGAAAQLTATVSTNYGGLLNGTVNLVENGNYITSASLGTPVNTFSTSQTISTSGVGGSPFIIAMADVNGDGIPDLLTSSSTSNEVSVFLGSGTGTFTLASTNKTSISGPRGIAVGDFFGHGMLDFAVVSDTTTTMEIWEGNNNGTFTYSSSVTLPAGTAPWDIATADINHDGILDLIIADYGNNEVTVYLGNGNGTFALKGSTPLTTGQGPKFLTVAPLFGTGNLDVAVADYTNNHIDVLKGNGDGTFAPTQTLITSTSLNNPESIVAADLLGNGFQDLVVTNYSTNPVPPAPSTGTVSVFLNNGSGVFTHKGDYAAGLNPYGLAVADINGDGIPDLVVTNRNLNHASNQDTVGVLIGNGDGSFNTMTTYPTGEGPVGVVVGSFTGGGEPDLAVVNYDVGTVSVMTSSTSAQAVLTTSSLNAGSNLLSAQYAGGSIFSSSTSTGVTQTVSKTSSVTVLSGPGTLNYNAPIVLTTTVTGVGGIVPTGTVSLYKGANPVGSPVSLSNGTASISLSVLPAGTYNTYTAVYSGDNNYTGSTSPAPTFTVSQATPTITWATPAAIPYGTALSATQLSASSGGIAGTFAYTPASGAVLTAGSQTLSVTFTPTDVADYTTATATVALTVNQTTPTLAWATPAAIPYGTALSATQLSASSGGIAGTFAYTPASGAVLTAGSQTLSVTFTPTDVADYTAATATVALTVNKATPTLAWATPAAIPYGTALGATQLSASSGGIAGTFAYTPASGVVLTAGSQTLSVTFTPTDVADYTTATATVALTVNKATPTLAWATPAAIPYGTALSATQLSASSSGIAGTFAYTPALGAVLTAGSQTLSVTFTPTDVADYTTATATVALTVNKATPTLAWATPAAIPYGTALSATQLSASSSGIAGTFAYTPASGVVLTAGSQTLSVTFTPTDVADYTTATATVALTVNKATPTLAWATPAAIPYGTALSATQLSASSGGIAGTFAYTPASGVVLTAGSQTLSVTFSPTDVADYTTATATVALTVAQQPLTVTVSPSSYSRALGAANPIFTGTVAGAVNNDLGTGSLLITYSTTASTSSPIGSYPVTATLGGPAAASYVLTDHPGTLSVWAQGVDLIESAFTGPASAGSGGTIQVTDTVTNQGIVGAGGSTTGFYISTNGVTKGTYIGYRYSGTLSAGASSGPVTTTLTLPTSLSGAYYVMACANYNNGITESNTTNNCAAAPITVAGADLIESAVSVLTTTPASGSSIQVSDTVLNQGGGVAGASTTGFYISASSTATEQGTFVGYRYVGQLSAGASAAPVTTTLTLPTNLVGTYYLIACANYNGGIVESNTTNNCTAVKISVAGADLIESAMSILTTTPALGGSVQVSDTALNQGGGTAGMSTTGFYLSTNGTTKGTYLGYRYVGALNGGANSGAVTTTLTLPANTSGGNYYVIACANYNNGITESNTSNDCTASSNTMLVP